MCIRDRSWQWAFVIGGSLLLVYGVLWLALAVPRLAASVDDPKIAPGGNPEVAAGNSPRTVQARPQLGEILLDRTLWLLTLSYAAYGYFQYLFFYWLGYYFKEILEIPPIQARWTNTWIMLTMGVGMAVGGRLTDLASHRWGVIRGRRTVVIVGMGLGAVLGLAGVGASSIVANLPSLGLDDHVFLVTSICLALSMASVGMCEGVFWTTSTDIGRGAGGTSGAFMNTGGNIGGLIAPVLTPFVALEFGWTVAIGLACVVSAAGGLIWLWIVPPTVDDGQAPELP